MDTEYCDDEVVSFNNFIFSMCMVIVFILYYALDAYLFLNTRIIFTNDNCIMPFVLTGQRWFMDLLHGLDNDIVLPKINPMEILKQNV
jgi:hypothetical protein